jgi:hypothetical protein
MDEDVKMYARIAALQVSVLCFLGALVGLKLGLRALERLKSWRGLIRLSGARIAGFALIVACLTLALTLALWLVFGNAVGGCGTLRAAMAQILKCYLGNWPLHDWELVDLTAARAMLGMIVLISVFIMPNVAVAVYVAAFDRLRVEAAERGFRQSRGGMTVNVDDQRRRGLKLAKREHKKEVLGKLLGIMRREAGLCRPGKACSILCLAIYWYFAGHSFADIGRLLDEAEDRRSVRGMTVGSKTLVEKMRRSQWKKRAPRETVRSVQVASL